MKTFVNDDAQNNLTEFDISARELDMKYHDTESGNRARFAKNLVISNSLNSYSSCS